MTYLNAKKYLATLPSTRGEERPGARLSRVLSLLGDPQKHMNYLLLTGSNGKSICASLLLSAYQGSDFLVGYLSPHGEEDPRHSVRIGADSLSMERFAELTDRIRRTLAEEESDKDATPIPLTRSEFFLCLALLAFREAGCRFCLIEGDLSASDTTRALHAPFGAVICGTIPHANRREIQLIRGGIRHGIREIVSAPQDREAYAVISDTCAAIHCRLTIPPRAEIRPLRLTLRSTEFSYFGKPYRLSLCGRFQITNATVVLETLSMLGRMGYPLSEEQIRTGLEKAVIPCKFEILSVSPAIIADSTHSPVAIETVCESMADFRDMIGSSVRLCLPDGDLVEQYTEILRRMDYDLTQTLLLSDRRESEGDLHRFAKPKELIRAALRDLAPHEILLISGPHAFTAGIRYGLLQELNF